MTFVDHSKLTPASSFGRLTASRLALGLLLAILVSRAALFAVTAFGAVQYPWELDYGEGIVWQQMRWIFTDRAYGPIDGFPGIVFHYTPLYHAVTSLASGALGTDELATGRSVSLLSLVAAAAASALIVGDLLKGSEERATRILCGSISGLLVFTYLPVVHWAPLMRVDMLAIALTLFGLLAAMRSLDRPNLIYVAAVCFVAAIYTKQTCIAAPAAAFGVLLLVRPKLAFTGVLACAVLGLGTLLILNQLTDGGFYRHIFLYNVNRLDPARLLMILGVSLKQFIYVAVGCAVIYRLIRSRVERYGTIGAVRQQLALAVPDVRLAMALAYFAVTTLMLLLVAKSGSSINYFLEWFFALGLFIGFGSAALVRSARAGERSRSPLLIGVPLVLALQAAIPERTFAIDAQGTMATEYAELSRQISTSGKPVISDDMVVLLRSGQDVLWEPAIFAELASTGAWDERPFVERIRNREFGFFVTWQQRGHPRFDERYNPAVAEAIDAAYPAKQKLAGLTIHRPLAQPKRDLHP